MERKTRPTIRAIAEKTGVACSTVSRALRHHPRISAATRAKVAAAAQRLGYELNPMASSVMSHVQRGEVSDCCGKIAWLSLVPADEIDTVPWLRALHRGAKTRAVQSGFLLEDFWLNGKAFPGDRTTAILQARGVQGLVIPNYHPYLDELKWDCFANAVILTPRLALPLHMAGADHLSGTRRAVQQLRSLGYERIGLVLHPFHETSNQGADRAAFLLETAATPARCRIPILWLPEEATEAQLIACFDRWIKRNQPDVVMGVDERFLGWARTLNIDVPSRLGLVHLSRHPHLPEWAGIDHHEEQIGSAAVDLVTGQLMRGERGIPSFRKQVLITGTWVDGETVSSRNSRCATFCGHRKA